MNQLGYTIASGGSSVTVGTGAGTVAAGDDYRIVNTIRPLLSGQWRSVLGSSQGTGTHGANVERAQLIALPPGTILQAVAISVVTLAASSAVRLGARADASGRAGTLLADWGTVDTTTTGTKTLAISYTVPAGVSRLWLTATAQGGAPVLTTRLVSGSDIDGLTAAEVVSNGTTPGALTQTGVSGALPNPFTFSASLNAGTLIAVQAA